MEELNTKNTQNFTNSQDNDEMQFTIADIWSIFVKNKWWMFAGVVVCLIVACFHLCQRRMQAQPRERADRSTPFRRRTG